MIKRLLKTIPAIFLSFVFLASSALALNTVSLSPEYFANPTIGRPIANAQIYVGIVDLDPEVPANQKQLSVLQESGAVVAVPQPISTSAGGIPEYNGSPVTLLVDGSYSIKVNDNLGTQLYYVPKNAELEALSSIGSIADLRAITTTPADGDVFTVLGYYTPGDGGGGQFYWDATSVLADNGGTIIKVTTITTGRWVRTVTDNFNALIFGAVGDGSTDDSTAIQNAIDASGVGTIITGYKDKVFYASEIIIDKKLTLKDIDIKHKGNPVLQNETTWTLWPSGPAITTGQETCLKITADDVILKNITIDGNANPYPNTGYPNAKVIMVEVRSVDNVMLDNVHISRNNGVGVFVLYCEFFTFQNGSITKTVGITGTSVAYDQILIEASRHCKVLNSEFGDYSPGSCIATNGGFLEVDTEAVVGGLIPFRTSTIDYTQTGSFGDDVGESDTYNIINGNTLYSNLAAGEALGGGVLGRMLTINSGRTFVTNNVVYDTSNLAQGGIGIGHQDQPTIGSIPYGIRASRSEVSGNEVFGFRKATPDQGFGIASIGSEDAKVHDNIIYNCNSGIYHYRYATNSSYYNNDLFFNSIAFEIGDVSGSASSHGLTDLITIKNNRCINNLQDVIMESQVVYTGFNITGNEFVQYDTATTQEQFNLKHGVLEFNDNKITNYSTGICATFYAAEIGEHVEFNDNVFVSKVESATPDFILFTGDIGGPVGRGSLSIDGLVVDVLDGVSGYNRRLRIREPSIKGTKISSINFKNCYLSLNSGIGDITIDGGLVETQGSDAPLSISVATLATVSMVKVSDIIFPAFGSTYATSTSITAGAGWITYNNCYTKENKDISDRANGNQIQSNDCYKITAGVLTTSNP